ncbi:hypothetical protein FHX15_005060 [Rhizobium sp. BK650]|nr:hypothetical protein [Rhizobium sp. BK650]
MATTSNKRLRIVSVAAVLLLLSSSADAKQEPLGPYRPALAAYRLEGIERISACLTVNDPKPVRWWVTDAKGKSVIAGQQVVLRGCKRS